MRKNSVKKIDCVWGIPMDASDRAASAAIKSAAREEQRGEGRRRERNERKGNEDERL